MKKKISRAFIFVFNTLISLTFVHASALVPGFPEQYAGSSLEQEAYRSYISSKNKVDAEAEKNQKETVEKRKVATEAAKQSVIAEEHKQTVIQSAAEALGLTLTGNELVEQLLQTEYANSVLDAIQDAQEKAENARIASDSANEQEEKLRRFIEKKKQEEVKLISVESEIKKIDERIDAIETALSVLDWNSMTTQEKSEKATIEYLKSDLILRDYETLISYVSNNQDGSSTMVYRMQVLQNRHDEIRQKVERLKSSVSAACRPSSVVGDPVHILSGTFYYNFVDTSFAFGKNVFPIWRMYRSGSKTQGVFGFGWFGSFESCIAWGTAEYYETEYFDLKKIKKERDAIFRELNGFEILNDTASVVQNSMKLQDNLLDFQIDCIEKKINETHKNINSNQYVTVDLKKVTDLMPSDSFIYIDEFGNMDAFYYDQVYDRYESVSGNSYAKIQDDHSCVLYRADNWVVVFNEFGQIVCLKDNLGVGIEFEYDENHRLSFISHKNKKMIQFEYYYEGCISCVRNLLTNKKTEYGYNSNSNSLVSLIDENKASFEFCYDINNDITDIFINDVLSTHVIYGLSSKDDQRRVVSVTNAVGGTELFDFQKDNNELMYIDADGFKSVYSFDNGNLVKEFFPDGTYAIRTYDNDGFVCETFDVFNHVNYEYDANGNVAKLLYQDGTFESRIYDLSSNNLISILNRDGILTEYEYDSAGQCTRIIREGKEIASFVYNEWGGLEEGFVEGDTYSYKYDDMYNLIFDNQTQYFYDEQNRLKKIISPNGESFLYSYQDDDKTVRLVCPNKTEYIVCSDSFGNIVSRVTKDLITKQCFVEKFEYNSMQLLTNYSCGIGFSESEALSSLQKNASFFYYPSGKVSLFVRWNTGSAVTLDAPGLAERYKYNGSSEIVEKEICFVDETCNPCSEIHRFTFDTCYENDKKNILMKINGINAGRISIDEYGNFVEIVDGAGRMKTNLYSSAGILQSTKSITGAVYEYNIDNSINKILSVKRLGDDVFSVNYDEFGRVTDEYIYGHHTRKLSYNDFNADLKKVVVESEGKTSEIIHDLQGNLISLREYENQSSLKKESLFYYDFENRCVNVNANGKSIDVTYDMQGNPVKSESLNLETLYDQSGNVIYVKEDMGDGSFFETFYSYNCVGLLSTVFDSSGRQLQYKHDAMNNVISVSDAAGVLWSAEYDVLGNLIMEKGRLLPCRTYEYDGSGNVICIKEAGDIILSVDYSFDLRIVKLIFPNNRVIIKKYDSYGNLVAEIDSNGEVKQWNTDEMNGQITLCDRSGRFYSVCSDTMNHAVASFCGNNVIKEIKSDSFGNILEAKNNFSNLNFVYSGEFNLIEVNDGKNAVNYSYDNLNRLKSYSDSSCLIEYEYDSRNRVTKVSLGDNYRVFEYNNSNDWFMCTDSSGCSIFRSFDEIGRIVSIEQKDNFGKVVFAQSYLYNTDGRLYFTICTDDDGSYLQRYSYDKHGRLVKTESLGLLELRTYAEDCAKMYEQTSFSDECYETMIFSSVENDLLYSFYYKYGKIPNVNESCWVEYYTYDNCDNCILWSTPVCKIHYLFDEQNHLISSFAKDGRSSIVYSYDVNGNLVSKEASSWKNTYLYSDMNQLISFIVDYSSGERKEVNYSYDSLGRLVQRCSSDGLTIRNTYAGKSFVKIKEECFFCDSEDGQSYNAKVRYRHIPSNQDNESEHVDVSYYLWQNGDVQMKIERDGDAVFYLDDKHGSVRRLWSTKGDGKSVRYSDYGSVLSPVLDEMQFLYCGKEFDPMSQCFNYGFRFYNSDERRFINEDPMHDGTNWFCYCKDDPINYSDELGLVNKNVTPWLTMTAYGSRVQSELTGAFEWDEASDYGYDKFVRMESRYGVALNSGGESGSLFYMEGCYATYNSYMLTELTDQAFLPSDVNNRTDFFMQKSQGDLDSQKIAEEYGLFYNRWNISESNMTSASAGQIINAYNSSLSEYVLSVQVRYTASSNTCLHFVGTSGATVLIDGTEYVKIIGTSDLDSSPANRRDTWLFVTSNGLKSGGEKFYSSSVTYVPVSEIASIRVSAKSNCPASRGSN